MKVTTVYTRCNFTNLCTRTVILISHTVGLLALHTMAFRPETLNIRKYFHPEMFSFSFPNEYFTHGNFGQVYSFSTKYVDKHITSYTIYLFVYLFIYVRTRCGSKEMRLATLCTNRQCCCLPLHMAVTLTPAVDSVQV